VLLERQLPLVIFSSRRSVVPRFAFRADESDVDAFAHCGMPHCVVGMNESLQSWPPPSVQPPNAAVFVSEPFFRHVHEAPGHAQRISKLSEPHVYFFVRVQAATLPDADVLVLRHDGSGSTSTVVFFPLEAPDDV
jgi:hypothetical protein